ncbi:pyridoxamine 5'-phosphate oxidase family protein [Streptomyces sp. NPDC021749]|uniref:helix-turn-helix domain-containing protein n=1 Tax=Streptomyces sp. NPDC021749 TaxID=3154905 RepID=UPI0033CD67F8
MTHKQPDPPSEPVRTSSDLGRRAALRRQQLGLTREEVAARTAASPEYLRYVEESAAEPGIGFLLRLAGALDTTAAELAGGTVDLPAGFGTAADHPEVLVLSSSECRRLLSTHGVGRVAVTVDGTPAIFPVNYTVADEVIAYRTAPESGPAAAAGREVALEVDHLDEAFSQGWSVLVVGPAHAVTNVAECRRLDEHAHTGPWIGDGRHLWISLHPIRITGRRIRVMGARAPSTTTS